jgi:hypothetical protein
MTDLSDRLREAKRRTAGWSQSAVYEWIVKVLALYPESTLDWDIGAGEEWARVLFRQAVIAYFRLDLPLVFIAENRMTGTVQDFLEEVPIVITFLSAESKEFSLDLASFHEAFPGHEWRQEACNLQCFSANDLHWMTAT